MSQIYDGTTGRWMWVPTAVAAEYALKAQQGEDTGPSRLTGYGGRSFEISWGKGFILSGGIIVDTSWGFGLFASWSDTIGASHGPGAFVGFNRGSVLEFQAADKSYNAVTDFMSASVSTLGDEFIGMSVGTKGIPFGGSVTTHITTCLLTTTKIGC